METFKIADYFDNGSTDYNSRLKVLNASRRYHSEEEFDVPAQDLRRMQKQLMTASKKLQEFIWINMAKELIRKGVIVIGAQTPIKMPSIGKDVVISGINLITGMTQVKYLSQKGTETKGEWNAVWFILIFESHFPDGSVPMRTSVPRFSSAILNLPSGKKRGRSSHLSYNRRPGEATTSLDELWDHKS